MNYLKTSAIGIDAVIKRIQTILYDTLIVDWVDNIDGYGRIYKNQQDDSFIPEFYVGNGQYKDTYYDDEKACTFCFIEEDEHSSTDELVFIAPVKCVFMVNLEKIFPLDVERSDTEAQRDVTVILRDSSNEQYQLQSIQKGIENVFSGFEVEQIKFSNIHPYHCFSINVDLSYYITEKCL